MKPSEFMKIENEMPYLETIDELPRRLVIMWKWPGYQSELNQVPEEFGRLELEPLVCPKPHLPDTMQADNYLWVAATTVNREFRKCGYKTELYNHACRVARQLGYVGIAFDPMDQFSDVSHIWRWPQYRRAGPYVVLEEPQERANWVKIAK